MKRVICAILAVFFMSCSIQAFAANSGEILFRNIPWGITLDEFVGKLESEGFVISSVDTGPILNVNLPHINNGMGCRVFFGEEGTGAICKVAGYDVCQIVVMSICNINDGEIDTNYKNCVVYSAGYVLSNEQGLTPCPESTEKDLLGKLSHLYGEYSSPFDGYYEWNGENKTKVLFISPLILYADYGIEKHIEELERILYLGTNDLSGL